jgi:hypothetical protein
MKFGRVEGFVQQIEGDRNRIRLIVTLETRGGIQTIRDEVIEPPDAFASADLMWLADQYTQETIGGPLAEQGWEPVGAGEPPEPDPGSPPKSSSYAVRNLG